MAPAKGISPISAGARTQSGSKRREAIVGHRLVARAAGDRQNAHEAVSMLAEVLTIKANGRACSRARSVFWPGLYR